MSSKRNADARRARNYPEVASHFRVTKYRVSQWKQQGCPALLSRPYDLEAIADWLQVGQEFDNDDDVDTSGAVCAIASVSVSSAARSLDDVFRFHAARDAPLDPHHPLVAQSRDTLAAWFYPNVLGDDSYSHSALIYFDYLIIEPPFTSSQVGGLTDDGQLELKVPTVICKDGSASFDRRFFSTLGNYLTVMDKLSADGVVRPLPDEFWPEDLVWAASEFMLHGRHATTDLWDTLVPSINKTHMDMHLLALQQSVDRHGAPIASRFFCKLP